MSKTKTKVKTKGKKRKTKKRVPNPYKDAIESVRETIVEVYKVIDGKDKDHYGFGFKVNEGLDEQDIELILTNLELIKKNLLEEYEAMMD